MRIGGTLRHPHVALAAYRKGTLLGLGDAPPFYLQVAKALKQLGALPP